MMQDSRGKNIHPESTPKGAGKRNRRGTGRNTGKGTQADGREWGSHAHVSGPFSAEVKIFWTGGDTSLDNRGTLVPKQEEPCLIRRKI